MNRRSTSRRPALLRALACATCGGCLLACSNGGSASAHDGATDAPAQERDARDAMKSNQDATLDGAPDGLGDGTSDADEAGREGEAGANDATGDGPQDAHAEAAFDAGPPALRYIGRTLTDGTDPDGNGNCTAGMPCFEWSGSQVVARFTGATSIALTMSDYGNYFDVYVNGSLQAGGPILGAGTQTSYPLTSGLDAASTYEVRLIKRTEASTAGRTQIQGVTFPGGGSLLSPSAPAPHRLEVVGDSISCGYGVLGASAMCTGTPAVEDDDDSYGAITAVNLNAELHTTASSGRGMYRNDDGTTTGTLPLIYGQTLPYGTTDGGVRPMWTFSSWVPDAVVIDLGTNDFVGGDPGQPFVTAYVAFLKQLRQYYPSAYILCLNGPMLSGADYTSAATYIQSAISTVADPKVHYLAFPTQTGAEGCDGHPSVATQAAMATQLTAALHTALGW
jgi:lysophospholipase L1-like esterase